MKTQGRLSHACTVFVQRVALQPQLVNDPIVCTTGQDIRVQVMVGCPGSGVRLGRQCSKKCWMRWIDPAFIKWEAGSLFGNELALRSEACKFRPKPPELNPEHNPNHDHPALISNSDLPGLLIQPMWSFQVFASRRSKLAGLGAFRLQDWTALNPQTLNPPLHNISMYPSISPLYTPKILRLKKPSPYNYSKKREQPRSALQRGASPSAVMRFPAR